MLRPRKPEQRPKEGDTRARRVAEISVVLVVGVKRLTLHALGEEVRFRKLRFRLPWLSGDGSSIPGGG